MLVAQDLFSQIEGILERAYLDFTYLLVGDDFFTTEQKRQVEAMGLILGRKPLVEILYLLVRQRSEPGYQSDKTLQDLLTEIIHSQALPVLLDTQWYSLEHAKRLTFEALQDQKQTLAKKVKKKALEVNEQLRREELVAGMPTPQERKDRDHSALALITAMVGTAIAETHRDFLRNATELVTNVVANGVLDTAVTLRRPGAKVGIQVFKTVINDHATCEWCHHFYTNRDGTPKIYDVAHLLANGTNDGKPKSEWRPVLGSTHPRCRCQLHYVGQK